MQWPKFRITMRWLMLVIAAFAVGLAISPETAPWLGVLTPVALILGPLRNWVVISVSIILLVFCALIEMLIGGPITASIYLPLAIIYSGAIGFERPILQHRKRLAALVAANAVVLALFLVPWTTRKPFLRDLYSIKPGMSVAEARKIMARWVDESRGIDTGNSISFRHSIHDARFNADFGQVDIQNGKVVGVWFSPD
jgi:hypothetical protein